MLKNQEERVGIRANLLLKIILNDYRIFAKDWKNFNKNLFPPLFCLFQV